MGVLHFEFVAVFVCLGLEIVCVFVSMCHVCNDVGGLGY